MSVAGREKPVCLVTGVGPEHGTGAEIARRFSTDYRVAMLARNTANLKDLAAKYDGGAYPCDVGDLDALVETVDRIKVEMGPPKIVIHNAPRAFFFVASLPRRRASSSASIAPGSLAIAARAASSNARFHSAVHAHRLALSH